MSVNKTVFLSVIMLVSLNLSGCASSNANPQDPFEGFNRGVYRFNNTLDNAVLKPVAEGYNTALPGPARNMIHNFFSNIDDILVTANDLLQLKFKRASHDFTRVWVNSIFGIFGLFDVAHNLEKHNEDFGQTLGYWGVGSGPYLVLPIIGPSSVRDGTGWVVDTYYGIIENTPNVDIRWGLWATYKVDQRAQLLDAEKVVEDTLLDRYSYIRDAYLMRRQSLVYDGDPPRVKYDDEDDGK